MYSFLPTSAPRCLLPSLVTFDFVYLNIPLAVSYLYDFTVNHNFFAFGKYPNLKPKIFSLFHRVSIVFSFPT